MNKIVIVRYYNQKTEWFPYSLETLEAIASSAYDVECIEIIECGVKK